LFELALLYGSVNRTAGLHRQLLAIIANSGWVTDDLQTIEKNLRNLPHSRAASFSFEESCVALRCCNSAAVVGPNMIAN
jgi:hypothetical protein